MGTSVCTRVDANDVREIIFNVKYSKPNKETGLHLRTLPFPLVPTIVILPSLTSLISAIVAEEGDAPALLEHLRRWRQD